MREWLGAITVTLLAGCAGDAVPDTPGPCASEMGCTGGTPHGVVGGVGGGNPDASLGDATAPDASGPFTTVAVTGSVQIATSLPITVPPGPGLQIAAAWDIRLPTSLGALTQTSDAGVFAIAGIALSTGVLGLDAVPASESDLTAHFETIPTGPSVPANIVAVTSNALGAAATSGGVAVDPAEAHMVIEIEGTLTQAQGAAVVANDGSGRPVGQVLYDLDIGGFSASSGVTGTHGTMLIVNLPSSAAGAPITFTVTHSSTTATINANAYPQHVQFVVLPATW